MVHASLLNLVCVMFSLLNTLTGAGGSNNPDNDRMIVVSDWTQLCRGIQSATSSVTLYLMNTTTVEVSSLCHIELNATTLASLSSQIMDVTIRCDPSSNIVIVGGDDTAGCFNIRVRNREGVTGPSSRISYHFRIIGCHVTFKESSYGFIQIAREDTTPLGLDVAVSVVGCMVTSASGYGLKSHTITVANSLQNNISSTSLNIVDTV
eukprot:PhF_6_TR12711/c0_g1_i1/m.20163